MNGNWQLRSYGLFGS